MNCLVCQRADIWILLRFTFPTKIKRNWPWICACMNLFSRVCMCAKKRDETSKHRKIIVNENYWSPLIAFKLHVRTQITRASNYWYIILYSQRGPVFSYFQRFLSIISPVSKLYSHNFTLLLLLLYRYYYKVYHRDRQIWWLLNTHERGAGGDSSRLFLEKGFLQAIVVLFFYVF